MQDTIYIIDNEFVTKEQFDSLNTVTLQTIHNDIENHHQREILNFLFLVIILCIILVFK